MPGNISSSNAVYMLTVETIFPVPQQLQGFGADEIFSSDPLATAETLMGVDGRLSGGYVFNPFTQRITLQADSTSNAVFDQWSAASKLLKTALIANAVIFLPAIGIKWTLTRGFLTSYQVVPDAQRVLQPRRHGITWEAAQASPA